MNNTEKSRDGHEKEKVIDVEINIRRGRPNKIGKSKKVKKKFRICCKNLFLTYPRCYFNIDKLIRYLLLLLEKYGVKGYVVRKLEKEGKPYYQVLISLLKKFNTIQPNFFDITEITYVKLKNSETGRNENSYMPVVYHGEYEAIKSETNTLNYITKDIFTLNETLTSLRYNGYYTKIVEEKFNFMRLHSRLIDLANIGDIPQAMDFLKNQDSKLFREESSAILIRLGDIFYETYPVKSPIEFQNLFEK
jgi:hypothetical protein